jgi:hypothetical protein
MPGDSQEFPQAMTKLERIDAAIQSTTNKKFLRLLNRAYWREWFQTDDYVRFVNEVSVHTMDK